LLVIASLLSCLPCIWDGDSPHDRRAAAPADGAVHPALTISHQTRMAASPRRDFAVWRAQHRHRERVDVQVQTTHRQGGLFFS
jgi:hypothetical protein